MDTGSSGIEQTVSARLEKVAAELKELEPLVRSGDIDARVLREFRESVDFIRTTPWAVEQFIALRDKHQDPYSVLPLLTLERVRRAAQLTRDLSLDLDSTDVSVETPGLEVLYSNARGLYDRLHPLFRGHGA
jgi:hypothetical protein